MERKTLVMGATGKTGRRVSEKIGQLGIPFRAGSRKGNPSFDWEKPLNWEYVLEDIEKVYITVQPDFWIPGTLEKVSTFVDKAKTAGVEKIVLLSGRGEEEAEKGEQIVINSGLAWTVVRASWFMQNFSEYFFHDFILEGRVIVPPNTAPEPFVDVDDIADVVVAALTDDRHEGKIYELTGPELLSIEEATAEISRTIGRPVAYQEIPMDDFTTMLRNYQIPEEVIGLLRYLFGEVLDGRNESVTGDIAQVLGRKAGSFRDYAAKTHQSGIWAA